MSSTTDQTLDGVVRWGRPRLLVLGDLMLDRYTTGETERVSPEAPVLVLRSEDDEVRPGGAANVAAFLRGLEADVTVLGVVGDDSAGRTLRTLLTDLGMNSAGVLTDPDRSTTVKQRFAGRTGQKQPQQLLRVDHEDRTPLTSVLEQTLQQALSDHLPNCAALLISDYHKGVCTPAVVHAAIVLARQQGIPVLVDPSREADFTKYTGATLLTPNRHAAETLAGRTLRAPDVILATAAEVRRRLGLEALVITLDREGLAYATAAEQSHIPCRPRALCDVTGAGDMVLSVLGLCQAAALPLRDSLHLANAAAGLEVERFGVVPITRAELAAELRGQAEEHKQLPLDQLVPWLAFQQLQGRSIVFTNGCFDLLHVGHVTLLQEAARLGDILVVAINSDASVRALKGPERPVIGERDRARMLAALACVDYVLVFDEATPHRLLEALQPDVLVKGGTTAEIVGRDVVEAYGGQVVRLGTTTEMSTTHLVQRIRRSTVASPGEVPV